MQFELKMKCVVIKTVTVQCDSWEEAKDKPWENCIDEMESDMVDWEVESIECIELE